MVNLEQKTGDMCINHYRAKLNPAVTEEELRHANCSGYNLKCENYRPARFFYVNLNHGRAVLVFR